MQNLPRRENETGQRVAYSGCEGEEFLVGGHRAFVILPAATDHGALGPQRWVWYAPTLPGLPAPEENWMFQRFLAAGLAIAGIDVGESFGSPAGRAGFTALYEELVSKRGFAPKPALLARSRGGLMLYNWAVEHPAAVACVAGIYPVCNLASYPGLAKAGPAYGLSEAELSANLAAHNPLERMAPLARARVPILHLHGDQDEIVPLGQNSAALAERYRAQGGSMELIIFSGQGHNYWPGWFQSPVLVDFVIAHAQA
ncbi:MAG: prolyl oligopeptidase family serine peptidase [Verrucomicrobia bacterium]|nr:prolyl oligopeptidase family serine peptidase [Verrucomicrobiota bacterium]